MCAGDATKKPVSDASNSTSTGQRSAVSGGFAQVSPVLVEPSEAAREEQSPPGLTQAPSASTRERCASARSSHFADGAKMKTRKSKLEKCVGRDPSRRLRSLSDRRPILVTEFCPAPTGSLFRRDLPRHGTFGAIVAWHARSAVPALGGMLTPSVPAAESPLPQPRGVASAAPTSQLLFPVALLFPPQCPLRRRRRWLTSSATY